MRELVAALEALPPGHPLATLLREAPDFRHEAALADALLHPQDRAYSVPQLFEFLDGAGLRFGRWVRQAPYSPAAASWRASRRRRASPQLPPAEQYAAAELFRGTMVRHSVVVLPRATAERRRSAISFAGDALAPLRADPSARTPSAFKSGCRRARRPC